METGAIITLTILFLASILSSGASSSYPSDDEFLDCLIHEFRKTNTATDVIHTPRNASYEYLLLPRDNLRPQSINLGRPQLIITPYHVSEIRAAIVCSKKLGIQIRVRSGGHDYEGLSYVSEKYPFVIVDMENFRSVTVNTKEKTARVQVGATLGQLYYTVAQRSPTLAVTAGVCPDVGVGGHFSGGGYGMLSRKHALAADTIIDAKLINAEGEILDRSSLGEDLFWAFKGGGGTSFGIVVEFKVKLVNVPETVTVFKVTRMGEQNATQLVEKWQEIADKVDENLLVRLFLSSIISPTSGNQTIAAFFATLFLGRVRDLIPLMQENFPELGLVEEDCIEMSWIESVLYFAGLPNVSLDVLLSREQSSSGLVYFKGKSDYVTQQIPVNGLRGVWRFLHEAGTHGQLQLSPYGGVLNTFSESETPFPHRSGNLFMIHYGVRWTNNSEAQGHIDWITRLYNFMEPYVSKSPRTAYFNYRDLELGRNNGRNTSYEEASVWGRKYFKNNFERLVRVKTKVDPSNFFRNEQSIPPLTAYKTTKKLLISPSYVAVAK